MNSRSSQRYYTDKKFKSGLIWNLAQKYGFRAVFSSAYNLNASLVV